MRSLHLRVWVVLLLMWFICFSVPDKAKAELHPGPRATCPICNARTAMSYFANRPGLSRRDKLTYIRRTAPLAIPEEVLKVTDQWGSLDVKGLRFEHDENVRLGWVEFGDGRSTKLYTIKNSDKILASGNSVRDVLSEAGQEGSARDPLYIMVDDITSDRSQNFLLDADRYNAVSKGKVKPFASEVYMDGDTPERLGTRFFAKNARLQSTSTVTTETVSGQRRYTATARFLVAGKNVSLKIFGTTKRAVQSFLRMLRNNMSRSPRASIARNVRISKQQFASTFPGQRISVLYDEVGITQIVRLPTKSQTVCSQPNTAHSLGGFGISAR